MRHHHRVQRVLKSIETKDATFRHNEKVIRATIVIGLTLVLVLPREYQGHAAYVVNLLWLLKL